MKRRPQKQEKRISEHNKSLVKKQVTKYRILLFSDIHKAPVQFQLSLRLFVAMGAVLAVMLAALVYFIASSAYSNRMLNETRLTQQQVQAENAVLKRALDEQDAQINELKALTEETNQKLQAIQKSDEEIRGRLGLEGGSEDTGSGSDSLSASGLSSQEDLDGMIDALAKAGPDLDGCLADYTSYIDLMDKQEKRVKAAASLRQQVVNYALQFVGGAYVYGGNDPHSGVDCSGFTRYILSHAAGIRLNRTASSQSNQGEEVTIDQAKPGDLLFYGDSESSIGHVAMYIGGGKVVHASTEDTGIIVSQWDYRPPVKIKNVIGN